MVSSPAAFFDRDGVLNRDLEYVYRPQDLEWNPGAVEAVRLCNEAGYLVLVVTNQSGVARGIYDEANVARFHDEMRKQLAPHGARIDDFRYCPHHPEARLESYRRTCACRKPAAGMILDLIDSWDVDASRSFLIGDKDIDLAAARSAGIEGYLYAGGRLDDLVRRALADVRARAPT